MLIYLFLGGNWCIRGENVVGVGIVWMVASWMFPHEIDSSPISLAFSFAVSEVSCFVWSCISLYCVLFSVVIVYFMDVAWLLPCDYSLVLILHCCAIDASILYTKLFLLNVQGFYYFFFFVYLFCYYLFSRLMNMISRSVSNILICIYCFFYFFVSFFFQELFKFVFFNFVI